MKGDPFMKIKNKLLIYSFITFFASFLAMSTPVFASETTPITSESTESNSSVQPCSDIIEYRYKEENGKLYRRLYNYTRGEWAEPYWHLLG